MPVPETDAGGRGENPETDGRTLVKELGKICLLYTSDAADELPPV